MKLIKFDKGNGLPVYVNPAQIVSLDAYESGCILRMTDAYTLYVCGSLDKVVEAIELSQEEANHDAAS